MLTTTTTATESGESSRTLPGYSPATDTPCYTSEPRPDEERLEINRRLIREESGVYVEKKKHVTLALTNQVPNCKEPTYGQGADVQGALSISKPENVLSVEVKLEGSMELTMASVAITNNTEIPVFTEQEVLFRRSETLSASESRRGTFTFSRTSPSPTVPAQICQVICPSTLTFSLKIPTTFLHGNIPYTLPPTYNARIHTIPGIHLDARYTLRAIIVRKGSLVDKKIVLEIPINFSPRSRPSRPSLPPSMTFLATLKSSPEEWKLFESQTALRDGHKGVPIIYSALLLPQSQVYPLNNPIPFHIQLSSTSRETLAPFSLETSQSVAGRLASLSKTFMTSTKPLPATPTTPSNLSSGPSSQKAKDIPRDQMPLRRSSSIATASSPSESASGIDPPAKASNTGGKISITIQRHISVSVVGQWIQVKRCISTNLLKQCPINDGVSSGTPMWSLAWEGQIEVQEEHRTCAGFTGPGVRVRDFILLSIIPPDSEHSPLREIHHLIPVRLTTDQYNEELIRGMELAL